MTVTMTSVWEETQAFVRQEWALLAPLALATLGVGNAGGQLAMGSVSPGMPMGMGLAAIFAVLAFRLLTLIGELAVTALALGSRQSVGEAIQAGLSVFWRVIGANLLVGLPFLLLLLPLGPMLAKSGISLTSVNPKIPGFILLYASVLMVALFYVSIRLVTLMPTLLDRQLGVVDSIKAAWRQTGPHVWVIFGVAILFLVVTMIVTAAITSILGAILAVIGKAVGAPMLGPVLTALIGGMIAAGFGIVSGVFVARLYRRIGGPGAA